jgi:hypothetical protein
MPRFFFHVHDGSFYADEHGTELPDQHRARNVALEILSHLVRGAADDLWLGSAFCVFAEDERRAPLFTLEVRALPASVSGGLPSSNTRAELH